MSVEGATRHERRVVVRSLLSFGDPNSQVEQTLIGHLVHPSFGVLVPLVAPIYDVVVQIHVLGETYPEK